MKNISLYLSAIVFLFSCSNTSSEEQNNSIDTTASSIKQDSETTASKPQIYPINHATFVIDWDGITIYNDPNGGAKAFEGYNDPDIILISDIHGDHMNQKTLDSIPTERAVFVMPQAVAEKLPEMYSANARILGNGKEDTVKGITIEAIPMYNLPETEDSRHVKGRGNGYVLTKDKTRIYIAGDTEDIEEMRNLEDIDIAFVPMNLPYTMTVEQAAEGVIAFAPKVVYPYHYRGQEGLADVNKFKELVDAAGKNIEVRLTKKWYE